MPINLQIRWDLSLCDLLAKQKDGCCIFKTPHPGNWYTNNLVCAQLGIPMKVVDHTKGSLDKNFHPHCVIARGKRDVVASEDLLTTHTTVQASPSIFAERFSLGTSVLEAHMHALADAIPQLNAQTVTQYFHKHLEKVMMLFEVNTRKDPSIWTRLCCEDGTTQNRRAVRAWWEIEHEGILGTSNATRGWVSPNVANILTDVTIDPLLYATDEIYELSGPDMYRYIDQLMPHLNDLYDHARSVLPWNLPATTTLNLVPVADMRFAVKEDRKDELENLITVWQNVMEFECGIGARMHASDCRTETIKTVSWERSVISNKLAEAVRACPEPFYNIYDGTFFSQYDLLEEKRPLHISQWALHASMKELAKAVKTMSHFHSHS